MSNLMERLGEPSTWASLAVILALTGVVVPPGASEAAAQVGAGVAALFGIFKREKGNA